MLWLWSMLTLLWMMWEDAIGNRRRGRWCLMSDMLECGLVLELRRATYIIVSRQDFSDITTRILVQLLIVPKDYDRDIDGAEDGKLMRLLEQTTFAL